MDLNLVYLLLFSILGSVLIKQGLKYIEKRYDKTDGFNWKFHFLIIYILLLTVYLLEGLNFNTIVIGLLIVVLYGISWYDHKTFWIPDILNLMVLIISLPLIIHNFSLGTLISLSIMLVIFLLIMFLYGKGLGGGDIKLYLIATLIFGYGGIVIFFLSMILSVVVILLYWLLTRKILRKIAFGPYISITMFIYCIWGDLIIETYLKLLGIW